MCLSDVCIRDVPVRLLPLYLYCLPFSLGPSPYFCRSSPLLHNRSKILSGNTRDISCDVKWRVAATRRLFTRQSPCREYTCSTFILRYEEPSQTISTRIRLDLRTFPCCCSFRRVCLRRRQVVQYYTHTT